MSPGGEGSDIGPLVVVERTSSMPTARRKALRRARVLSSTSPSHKKGTDTQGRGRLRQARGLVQILSLIGLAAAVLGSSGQMLAANRQFGHFAPRVVRHLRGRPQTNGAGSDGLVAALAKPLASGGIDGVHTIPVRGARGKPTALAHLIGLPSRSREFVPGATALLLVAPLSPDSTPNVRLLQRLFDLSPAESRVASAVASRRTVKAIAGDFGVSQETVRSQLKAVLAKTGTKRQLELALLLANLAMLRT